MIRIYRSLRVIFKKYRILHLILVSKLFNFDLQRGEDLSLGPTCNFRQAGNLQFGSVVTIGADCHVETNLVVGNFVLISSRVAFIGNDHSKIPGESPYKPSHGKANVNIGSNCWLGFGVTIIGDVTICNDVIIGAQSLVIKDITEPGVYVGSPARKIR